MLSRRPAPGLNPLWGIQSGPAAVLGAGHPSSQIGRGREAAVVQRCRNRGPEQAMKGDARVIEYLNRGLRHELTAINQYWLHYRLLDNWGYKALAKYWRKESIEEMQHADRIVDRIIFL